MLGCVDDFLYSSTPGFAGVLRSVVGGGVSISVPDACRHGKNRVEEQDDNGGRTEISLGLSMGTEKRT